MTREAELDVIEIARTGLAVFGERQARRYHEELFNIFDLIALTPEMARERRELTPPVRVHRYKAHLIVYLTDEKRDVLIIRVRHSHEDWPDA